MKFQRFNIQIITLALGVSLIAAGLTATSAYGLVKITSPAKGQQVPIGNIMISGTSSSNTTNHCTVSFIINGIKPYQQATSTGDKGPNDYSNWTFTAHHPYYPYDPYPVLWTIEIQNLHCRIS